MTRARHHLTFDPFAPIHVAVVGAGGTGSHLVTLLTEVHKGIVALGGKGLVVTVYDHDEVSYTNTIRQNYGAQEIGRNKAVTLVTRVNLACSLPWRAEPRRFTAQDLTMSGRPVPQVVFTCVDSNAARREVGQAFLGSRAHYWIDTGNTRTTGQVMLAQPARKGEPRLPAPTEEYAELLATDEEDTPSCSALESLTRQDLMINREVAVRAAGMLWRLLSRGYVTHRGVILNAESGFAVPKDISPDMVPEYKTPPVGLLPYEAPAVATPKPKAKATRKAPAQPRKPRKAAAATP